MEKAEKSERRVAGDGFLSSVLLELWPGWAGNVCGQIIDPFGTAAVSFRDLAELLIVLNEGGGRQYERRCLVIPRSRRKPARAFVSVLYRCHGSIQGILKTAGAEVPFRSGMELLYLLRAAAKAEEAAYPHGNGKTERDHGVPAWRGYAPDSDAVTG